MKFSDNLMGTAQSIVSSVELLESWPLFFLSVSVGKPRPEESFHKVRLSLRKCLEHVELAFAWNSDHLPGRGNWNGEHSSILRRNKGSTGNKCWTRTYLYTIHPYAPNFK